MFSASSKTATPITLTIKPVQGMDAQISMLENVEEVGYRSPDASMTWIFEDGVLETKVTGGTFTISKTLRGKIENVLVKMIAYWQQYFFRDVMEKNALRPGVMPVIDEDEADDREAPPMPEGADPLEEYEDDGEISGDEELDKDDPDIQEGYPHRPEREQGIHGPLAAAHEYRLCQGCPSLGRLGGPGRGRPLQRLRSARGASQRPPR